MLEDNKAKWHKKKCRNKVDGQKFRAQKKYFAECSVASPVKTRRHSLPVEVQHVRMETDIGDISAKSSSFFMRGVWSQGFWILFLQSSNA